MIDTEITSEWQDHDEALYQGSSFLLMAVASLPPDFLSENLLVVS